MSDDSGEEERLVAEIDTYLKQRARSDPRPIKEVVEDSLEREFSTQETAAIERRIEEKRQRIQTLDREISEREREKATEQDELDRLQQQLQRHESRQQETLEDARDALENTPKEEDNPAVKKWANRLGMTPTTLLDRL